LLDMPDESRAVVAVSNLMSRILSKD